MEGTRSSTSQGSAEPLCARINDQNREGLKEKAHHSDGQSGAANGQAFQGAFQGNSGLWTGRYIQQMPEMMGRMQRRSGDPKMK